MRTEGGYPARAGRRGDAGYTPRGRRRHPAHARRGGVGSGPSSGASLSPKPLLAICWALYAAVFGALLTGAGLAFGAACGPFLLTNKPGDAVTPEMWAGIGAGSLLVGSVIFVPGAITAWGLFRGARWAPIAALLLSGTALFNLPVGTALAIYTVIALRAELGFGGTPGGGRRES